MVWLTGAAGNFQACLGLPILSNDGDTFGETEFGSDGVEPRG